MTIKKIDFERAALLMDIMQKQAGVSPMLTTISGEAAEELKGIAEDCRLNGVERADRIRKEEQIAEQKRLEAVEAAKEPINPDPKPQPAQVLMPGEPDPNVRSEDVRARGTNKDKNADGLEDVQEPFVAQSDVGVAPVVDRRV